MAIKFYFLQSSRAIRTAFLLEALDLEYEAVCFDRLPTGLAPQEMKDQMGGLGKSPYLIDGDQALAESGAIAEYLCEKYDQEHRLLPATYPQRATTREWLHAAEGTYMLHCLSITYARWFVPETARKNTPQFMDEYEQKLSVNVRKDLDYLEKTLASSSYHFLVDDHLTIADIQMHFSVSFILKRELGTKDGNWPNVQEWLEQCEQTKAFQRAVAKTGYTL